jgi:hypothetical protein
MELQSVFLINTVSPFGGYHLNDVHYVNDCHATDSARISKPKIEMQKFIIVILKFWCVMMTLLVK